MLPFFREILSKIVIFSDVGGVVLAGRLLCVWGGGGVVVTILTQCDGVGFCPCVCRGGVGWSYEIIWGRPCMTY